MRWLPFALLPLAMVAAASAAAPRAVLDASFHDFGAVERGARVTHVFKIRNAGDAPLVLERAEPACACTVGLVGSRVVAPGAETWIGVDLDTSRLAGATAKSIVLRTSDPAAPELRLLMQGTVLAGLVADPPLLYLGEVRRGSGVERSLAVRSGRPTVPGRVERVEARGPFVRATLGEEGGEQRVVVALADTAPAGRFRDEVVLSGPSGRVVVPVLGVVRGELKVTPAVLEVGRGQARAELQVVNRGGQPIRVREIRVPRGVATYELQTVRRGFEYVVHLALRQGAGSPDGDERIQIVTDHPVERRLEVPLHLALAPAALAVR